MIFEIIWLSFWCTPWKLHHWVTFSWVFSKAGRIWTGGQILEKAWTELTFKLSLECTYHLAVMCTLEIWSLDNIFHVQPVKPEEFWTASQNSQEGLNTLDHNSIYKWKLFLIILCHLKTLRCCKTSITTLKGYSWKNFNIVYTILILKTKGFISKELFYIIK